MAISRNLKKIMCNEKDKPKFEKHFKGPVNAGVRQIIREAARSSHNGETAWKRVMGIDRTIALTAQGRVNLKAAADDYRTTPMPWYGVGDSEDQ